MYFVIILLLMTLHARDGKIRHSRKLNENVGGDAHDDSDTHNNADDLLVADNRKGDNQIQTRKDHII